MKKTGAVPITSHRRNTRWDFTVKESQVGRHSPSGFLTSCPDSEAILPTVNTLSVGAYTGHLLTMRKDETKWVQCTLSLAKEPIRTVWAEGDKETQSKSQMNYNTISCEQCNGRTWAFVISTPWISNRVIKSRSRQQMRISKAHVYRMLSLTVNSSELEMT